MYNPFSLKGKTILVTGASSGIGKAIAIECSKLGANIVVTGRSDERLKDTFSKLFGEGHLNFVADLTNEVQIEVLVNNLPEINGLVNAAGILKTLPFQFVNRCDLVNIFDINFFSPIILTQKLIKSKKIKSESSIVFLSSIEGPITAHIGNSMYASSKGAVTAMVKSMAIELAIKRIRVNSILPGMTETPLINLSDIALEQLEADKKLYPLKRYGKPEDIAYAAIYFLSDASSWVTGSNLIIDGGFTLL